MARSSLKDRVEGGGNYFASPKTKLQFISTGCKILDLALGGGWCEQRIANIIGDKSSGKSLMAIEACANFALKYPKKGLIKYRESEAAFDKAYAAALGMPVERVDFGDPLETVEDLFEDLESVIEEAKANKAPCLYILDSLDALSDRAELEREMDQGTYGTNKARNLSQLFRRLVRQMSEACVTILIISQVRSKIGGMGFGRMTTRSGGRALDFYASQVIYLTYTGNIKKTISGVSRPIGIEVKAKIDKNKISLPYREAEFKVYFGFGLDDLGACLDWLKSVKSLDLVGLKEREIKKYVADTMEDDDYSSELAKVHKVVEKRWYEIERSFMPSRRKYNVS